MTRHTQCTLFLLLAGALFIGRAAAAQGSIFVTTSADVTDIPQNATIDDLPGPDGVVSFREALRASDNTAGHQTVGFQIPEDDWYLPDIFPGQVLIQGSRSWSAAEPVTIDGTTQTVYTGDTYPDGNEVMIYGLSTYLNGDASVVIGLHSSRIEFNGSNNDIHGNTGGMFIALYFGSGTVVHDNEAETININYADQNTIIGNTTQRVRVTGQRFDNPAFGNRIGGPDLNERNFITGWGNWGEHGVPSGTTVELYYTRGTVIENNYIGTTPDGMAIGNDASTAGIGIFTRNDDLTIRDNLIAILARGVYPSEGVPFGQPIYLEAYGEEDGPCRNFEIVGNTLGLDAEGEPVLGGVRGIWVSRYAIEYCQDVRIQENVIAGHLETGVLMEFGPGEEPAGGIRLSANAIYANDEIGIDLMPNTWDFGPTPNDPLDADMGANGLQNYPVLAAAVNDGQSIHIVGELSSEPVSQFTLEFFASPECDPSGFGQGEVYLGATSVETDSAGDAQFDTVLAASVPSGWFLTSTATLEPIGATSEFSACVPIDDSGETAILNDVQVVTGSLLDGTVSDLVVPDDQYVQTASGFGQTFVDLHHMELIVSASTAVQSPVRLDLTIESRIDEPAGLAQIRLRNHATAEFEQIGAYGLGNTDSIDVINEISASNFVDGSGNIDLSIKHIVFVPFFAFTFESFMDHVKIDVR